MEDIDNIPIEIIKDRKQFQRTRIPQLEEEFTLKKLVVERNTFGYHGIVAINPIEFSAKCEHHLVGIHGKAYFAYIPGDLILGLSMSARVIEHYLNVTREIIQEESTNVIAEFFMKALKPAGLWLVFDATHECMSARGVKQRNSRTKTSIIKGNFYAESVRRETMWLWGL